MGAGTGNRNNMDAARRQQAMEGQAMRRRALEQQDQFAANEEQVTPFLNFCTTDGTWLGAIPQPSMGRGPEMRSGINFGPGQLQ
jgi:hypothetical protein